MSTLREVTRASSRGAPVIMLDGLEKCSTEGALRVVRALLDAREEARLVVIVPMDLAVGSGAHEIVTSFDRIFPLRAVRVRGEEGKAGEAGRAFLREIVRVRLGLAVVPEGLAEVLDHAAMESGGVPRSFLQIVRAAASYAALDEREVIRAEDLLAASRDHAESMARLLVDGDRRCLRDADGTSGVEIPMERRLRLLAHGLLLEYRTEHGTVVRPSPLLRDALDVGPRA